MPNMFANLAVQDAQQQEGSQQGGPDQAQQNPAAQKQQEMQLAQQVNMQTAAPKTTTSLKSNMFSSLLNPPPSPEAEQKDVDPKTGEPTFWQSFNDHITQFNRGFERVAEGGLQKIAQGIGAAGSAISGVSASVGQALKGGADAFQQGLAQVHNQKESNYNDAWKRSHGAGAYIADIAGNIGGATVALAPTLVGGPATIAGRVAYGAAQGGGLGALQYTEPGDSVVQNAITGAAAGAIGQTVVEGAVKSLGLSSGVLTNYVNRLLNPEKAVLNDVATRVSTQVGGDINKVKDAIKVANEKGVNLTPGQAIGGKELLNLEKTAIMPENQRAAVGKQVQDDVEAVKTEVQNTIDNIAQGHTKDSVNQLYSQLNKLQLSDDAMSTLQSNPIIKSTEESLSKVGGEKFNDLGANSVAKYDQIKQAIDKKINWVSKEGNTSVGSPEQKQELINARKSLVDTLDNEYGEIYQPARAAAQQLGLKQKWQAEFNRKGSYENEGGVGMSQQISRINMALFKNPKLVNTFLNDVETAGGPEAKAQAHDVIQLVKQTIKNPVKDILEKTPEFAAPSPPGASGIVGGTKELAKKITTTGYKRALFELLTSNNKWADQVAEVMAKKSQESKQSAFYNLIHKISATLDSKSPVAKAAVAGNAQLVTNRANKVEHNEKAPQAGFLSPPEGQEAPPGMLWSYGQQRPQ